MAIQFQTLGPDGKTPILIAAGQPFTTYWLVDGGEPVAFEVNHPWSALDAFGVGDLARYWIRAEEVEDPPPPRASLPKSTVTARLAEMGKAAAVWALFNAQPRLAFKWFAPDWPNVYVDDEGLLAVLNGIGLAEEQIAAVTAI